MFARSILDEKNGPPPEINLFNEKNNGETLLQLIKDDLIKSGDGIEDLPIEKIIEDIEETLENEL